MAYTPEQPEIREVTLRLPADLVTPLILELGGFLTRHDIEFSTADVTTKAIPEAIGDEIPFEYDPSYTTMLTEETSGKPVVAVMPHENIGAFILDKKPNTKSNGMSTRLIHSLARSLPLRGHPEYNYFIVDGYVEGSPVLTHGFRLATFPNFLDYVRDRKLNGMGRGSRDILQEFGRALLKDSFDDL